MTASWIQGLEEQVQRASAEIRRLRKENRRLQELAKADGGSGAEPTEWLQERDEVRRRVEELVERLEGLLAETQ